MRRAFLKMLALGAAAAVGCATLGAPALAAETKPVRIGWTAWSDAEAVTRLAERLITERLHQPVELVLADIGLQYQGLAKGDLDFMMMSWLPATHADYMEKLGDKVVPLGILYTRARLGWAVPDYVPADQVRTVADLAKPEVRAKLGGRIQGIDPGAGLMKASEKAIDAYGLKDYSLVSASGAAMTAALGRAERRKDWIVVTAWNPHWMFAKWKLRYLEDPEGALGGLERVQVMGRKGFYQDHPDIAEFLTRMYLPLEELEGIMLEADNSSYDKAIDDYIAKHKERVDYWVTGQMPAG
ncbi:glycine betaine ABC transporter substrate-binding protein [Azospirillum picis]|uniref:Glycine betaine/proline transport system substrate-binding protein n=1 Tax=Azospirillum picis TaxID=488438 RepID=A0ABU0MH82_9PROT|nr:glycine betaine ABC transporter substrate-binding protein [Azospirillum picis]MBP2298948.1 glycine betaine/proline transport system substrate-binding protein [Azospirillum picis]MDQ0532810.1 glycine betaine/proline transport system substrate-binding protein [Azospirillum picis]